MKPNGLRNNVVVIMQKRYDDGWVSAAAADAIMPQFTQHRSAYLEHSFSGEQKNFPLFNFAIHFYACSSGRSSSDGSSQIPMASLSSVAFVTNSRGKLDGNDRANLTRNLISFAPSFVVARLL